jgi:hypothetical protein
MATGSEGPGRAALAARRATRAAALALGLVASLASPARAADTEPIHIAFHAPAGCPDEAAFMGQVVARTARARVVAASEPGRTFAITIRVEGARTRGRLTIDTGQGSPAARDVVGGTCEEVVSALGLVTALAIDPNASTAPTVAPVVATPPPPSTPSAPSGPPPRYDPLPWWGPIGAPLPVIPLRAPDAPASRWRAGWGLLFGGASAVAPGLAEIARAGDGVLSPAFRLAMTEADTGFRVVGARQRARFALVSGRLEACPVRADVLRTLSALPCARFEAGELTASGLARVGLSTTRPWAAPGAGARIEWWLFDRLRLEAEAGASFPLVRDTFSFGVPPGPVSQVHAVPVAAGSFAAGVGTHFP